MGSKHPQTQYAQGFEKNDIKDAFDIVVNQQTQWYQGFPEDFKKSIIHANGKSNSTLTYIYDKKCSFKGIHRWLSAFFLVL